MAEWWGFAFARPRVLGALALREGDRIRERTRAGLEAARARGRHPGRPVRIKHEKHVTVLLLRSLGKSHRQVAASTGFSPSSVARICREETSGQSRYRHQQDTHPVLGDPAAPPSKQISRSVGARA